MIDAAQLPDEVTLLDVSGAAVTGTDKYGDPITADPSGVVVRAVVSPLDATEDEISRDVRLNRYVAVLEPDAPVDGLAKVIWKGQTYDVMGEPRLYPGHMGETDHVEVELRGVKG